MKKTRIPQQSTQYRIRVGRNESVHSEFMSQSSPAPQQSTHVDNFTIELTHFDLDFMCRPVSVSHCQPQMG